MPARPKRSSPRQLDGSLPQGESAAAKLTVAYEPVWAIGTGRTPTVDDIGAMHRAIRERLTAIYGEAARRSASSTAARSSPTTPPSCSTADEVGGALVGGASLTAESFLGIVAAAHERRSKR